MLLLCLAMAAFAQGVHPVMHPDSLPHVLLQDEFWKPRADKVANVTLPACIDYTAYETGRIRNFERAAGMCHDGKGHEGKYYDDADVYKTIEGIAYSLKSHSNLILEQTADKWINIIAAAQEQDGYINTFYSLTGPENRWSDMTKHEMFCAGHLIEAAVAYYDATGKRKLLDVAIKMADHINRVFGPGKRHWVTGHEEIELALVKLYRTTGQRKYLQLAAWLIDERGHGYGKGKIWENKNLDAQYCQDNVPVAEVNNAVGHAVRAMYYYTGATDVIALTHHPAWLAAMQQVWEDVVYRNMYLTGAIGSSRQNEGFTQDYDLPNFEAYNETCASVGMVLWNQRMNQLTGDAKYMDVLERTLYNGALAGISLQGDRFFYANPLASHGGYTRSKWFETACCPPNIARLLASVGSYIYAYSNDAVWLNLFIGSWADIPIAGNTVRLSQQTNYPWEGQVRIRVDPRWPEKFILRIRIPGWTGNEAVPGGLYTFLDKSTMPVTLTLNGRHLNYRMEKGYAVIERNWQKGDNIILQLPMPVRRIIACDSVKHDAGRVALQRGPLVYCLEGIDNNDQVFNCALSDTASLTAQWNPGMLGGITVIKGETKVITPSNANVPVRDTLRKQAFTAIPYYAWANRGGGQMEVWMIRE